MYPDTFDIYYEPTERDLQDWAEHLASLERLNATEHEQSTGEIEP